MTPVQYVEPGPWFTWADTDTGTGYRYANNLCMLICMFAGGDAGTMEALEPGPGRGISEENVTESAPFVRALVVSRLEQAWRACDPHIQVQRNPDTGLIMRPDPRFIEAGIRILDRLSDLYRLTKTGMPPAGVDQEDREALVGLAQLQIAAMEDRLRETGTGV